MKKYAFIFTAFLIAATLIGCGNPAGGNVNDDNRGIGAFEPGIWFYDYDGGDAEKAVTKDTKKNWVQYFVFDNTGKMISAYHNMNSENLFEKYNDINLSFTEYKDMLFKNDKRNPIPFYKVKGGFFDTPFGTGWYCVSFATKENDRDVDMISYILFAEESTVNKLIVKKNINKIITKTKDSEGKINTETKISEGNISDITKMNSDWYLLLININATSNKYTNFKFERCNESDVPVVTP